MKAMNRYITDAMLFLFVALVPLGVLSQAKLQPRVDLSYFRVQQEAPYLIVRVRTKDGKKFEPVTGVNVTLLLNDQELGVVMTGKNGEGKYVIPDNIGSSLDTLLQFAFSAKLISDAKLEGAEKEIEIYQSRLTLNATASQDGKQVQATIEKRDKTGWTPVSGVEMKLFIKRQFGRLPIGEETYTSDENGKVEMDFKASIPGDKSGKITLGCMIEDGEDLGNLTAVKEVEWGTPFVAKHDEFNDRTLWATSDKTPIWLLVFPNLIIVVVWGLIFYLLLQIVKIRKIGKETKS